MVAIQNPKRPGRRSLRKRIIPRPWKDRVSTVNHLQVIKLCRDYSVYLTVVQDLDRQKQAAYDRMDQDSFGWWTVITAFFGFATGAYDVRMRLMLGSFLADNK